MYKSYQKVDNNQADNSKVDLAIRNEELIITTIIIALIFKIVIILIIK